MIILIASISILVAYFVGKSLFGGAAMGTATVKTVAPINANITQPDPSIFNSNAINPSVQIQIDSSSSGTQ
jgi:hypothetical protein